MKLILFCCLLLFHGVSWGYDIQKLIDVCIKKEAQRRAIPPELILAIAKVESGLNWRAFNVNKNGTYDIGIMQINSSHIPRLEKLGIKREMLWHPCVNISVGAWILHENIAKYGMNWVAVAAYNTGNPSKNPRAAKKYVVKVHEKFSLLTSSKK